MHVLPPGVAELGFRLQELGWVTELFVGGSAATGDYVPGVSDIDCVALVDGAVDAPREATLTRMHTELDRGAAAGLQLGCAYVEGKLLPGSEDVHRLGPTEHCGNGFCPASLGRNWCAMAMRCLAARPKSC